jgi:hypothetical protein
MSKSAFSLRVFSIYMFALGAVLVAAPNLLLSFFDVPETHEVWIRVVGMLVLILGYLDFMASRNELVAYFHWTVPARLSVPAFFVAFVALGLAPPILVLFGAIDGAAAIWTAVCLRADSLTQPGAPADAAR